MTGRKATATWPCQGRSTGECQHPSCRPDAGRKATWTVETEGFDCPLCFHGVEMHDGESCTAPEGRDDIHGFTIMCGCPLTPPARETS